MPKTTTTPAPSDAAQPRGASLARRIGRAKAMTQPEPAALATKPARPGMAGAVERIDAVTRESLEAALGTKNLTFNVNLFARTMKTAYVFQGDGIDAAAEEQVASVVTLVGIKAFKPADPVEAMLAAQAVMLHNLAMEAGRRAQLPQQNADVTSKLRRDAANLSRSMVETVEALDRRRGRGQQTIRVERVQIQDGGQAIIAGSVVGGALPASARAAPAVDDMTPATSALPSPPPQQAVAEGRGSDTTGDALPVVAGDVMGEGE